MINKHTLRIVKWSINWIPVRVLYKISQHRSINVTRSEQHTLLNTPTPLYIFFNVYLYTRFSKVSFALNGQYIESLISQHCSINMPYAIPFQNLAISWILEVSHKVCVTLFEYWRHLIYIYMHKLMLSSLRVKYYWVCIGNVKDWKCEDTCKKKWKMFPKFYAFVFEIFTRLFESLLEWFQKRRSVSFPFLFLAFSSKRRNSTGIRRNFDRSFPSKWRKGNFVELTIPCLFCCFSAILVSLRQCPGNKRICR